MKTCRECGYPTPRTVGELVKAGSDFLNPGSDIAQRYRRALVESTDRAFAAEARARLRKRGRTK